MFKNTRMRRLFFKRNDLSFIHRPSAGRQNQGKRKDYCYDCYHAFYIPVHSVPPYYCQFLLSDRHPSYRIGFSRIPDNLLMSVTFSIIFLIACLFTIKICQLLTGISGAPNSSSVNSTFEESRFSIIRSLFLEPGIGTTFVDKLPQNYPRGREVEWRTPRSWLEKRTRHPGGSSL